MLPYMKYNNEVVELVFSLITLLVVMASNGTKKEASLAEALDEDLDHFVDQMIEKNKGYRYAQPLSEDNWEEELENIPLFMTNSPQDIDHEKSPALAALQTMKYEDEDPKAGALSYKDDGNEEFKRGNYKKAIKIYTEGIKVNCDDSSVMSTLFANRANAHFKIGNYRSSLIDSTKAKNIQPDYVKAIFRGACSCFELELYDDVISWCKDGLLQDSGMKTFQDLLKKATLKKKQQERDKRKKKAEECVKEKENNRLVDAIVSRGVNLCRLPNETESGDEDDKPPVDRLAALNLTNQHIPGKASVCLDDDGILHWPVLFVYPEYGQTDYIEAFNETHSFSDHIQFMFGSEHIPWDIENKYRPLQLEVYFEDVDKTALVFVKQSTSLSQVLSDSRYLVYGGTPSFIILVKDSPFQKQFKMKYNVER